MNFKLPKKTEKYQWTEHSVYKMKQYGLSAQRILRVIRAPKRKEEGIVSKTIAVMQPGSISHKNGKETWSQEIWAMYQIHPVKLSAESGHPATRGFDGVKNTKYHIPNTKMRIISVWRYPGVSPKRNPIPEDILNEIGNII